MAIRQVLRHPAAGELEESGLNIIAGMPEALKQFISQKSAAHDEDGGRFRRHD